MNSFYWISGLLLALIWIVPVIESAIHLHRIADITQPPWNPPQDTPLSFLTIVVPARNEAAEIESALRSLLALDYPGVEVIAIDDRSTDETGRIMDRLSTETGSDGKLRVLHVRELPPGWLGKTHAMWLGAQQGSSDWILFTDADCVFRPDTLRRAVHYATSNNVDHLVLFPTAHMRTWGERMMISFPQVVSSFILRPWRVRDANARDFIGIGAFNLVRRKAYTALGTYEALRREVVDDLKFGQAIKKAGLRQDVVFGRHLVSLRWAEGAAGVIRNLEKNLFAFFRFRFTLVFAACLALFFVNVWPFVGLFFAPGWAKAGFAVAIVMIAVRYRQTSPLTGVPTAVFLAHPISASLFAVAVLRSAFATIRDGGVTWRGTKYSLEELRKK